ncbi:MAG: hypothetical protein FWG99_07160 [Treponema sp.]|nr:hypothetical protein [Treponema sp.]
MKEIIVIQGAGDRGKTQTVKKVYDLLKAKYPKAKITDYFPGKYDIKILMENVNGLLVGIESYGDPITDRLEDSLKCFDKAGCDIIFCSARTRGYSVDWIKKYSKKYKITYIQQKYVFGNKNHQDRNNEDRAQEMIKAAGL